MCIRDRDITPTMFNYQTHADNGSMFNTPPCYAIYISMLVLDWIKNTMGGLEEMKKYNEKKAGILYHYLDNSKMFRGTVVPKDRSLMNVPFVTDSDELKMCIRDSGIGVQPQGRKAIDAVPISHHCNFIHGTPP